MKLAAYLLRRLGGGLATVLGVVTVCFVILHALPGDPTDAVLGETATAEDRAALRAALRLDRPLPVQYVEYLRDLERPSKPLLVGIGYALQEIERIEPRDWDVPLDYVATERELIDFTNPDT